MGRSAPRLATGAGAATVTHRVPGRRVTIDTARMARGFASETRKTFVYAPHRAEPGGARRHSMLRRAERRRHLAAHRRAESRAGVPARPGGVIAVVAARDVVERAGLRVELRIDETRRLAVGRVDARDQRGPQRRDRARAAHHRIRAADVHGVTAGRIGVAGHVGHAAPHQRARAAAAAHDAQTLLPSGQREGGADAAAGRAVALRGGAAPDGLARDLAVCGRDVRAAAAERVRARRREIDVIGAVGQAIRRAAVARCRAHRHAQRDGGLQRVVQRAERLLRPRRFGRAPTDRNDRGLALAVVQRRAHRVDETGFAVGREVHRDQRGRRERAHDLDVERHFAVRAVRVAGRRVLRLIDGHRFHLRHGHAERAEIGLEVGLRVAAAHFDQRDALAFAVAGGEIVEAREFERRERAIHGARGADGRVDRVIVLRALCRFDAKVRPHLRAIVEPDHGGDDLVHVVGQMHRAVRLAIVLLERADLMLEALQIDAERRVVLLHGTREHHAPRARVGAHDTQAMRLREGLDALNIGLRRAEALLVVRARNGLRARRARSDLVDQFGERGLRLAPQDEDDVEMLRGIASADALRAGRRRMIAACHGMTGHERLSCFRRESRSCVSPRYERPMAG
ncbi:hypothetical protein PT2222_30135 [Paraburkholderia tropica]